MILGDFCLEIRIQTTCYKEFDPSWRNPVFWEKQVWISEKEHGSLLNLCLDMKTAPEISSLHNIHEIQNYSKCFTQSFRQQTGQHNI